MIDPGDHRVAIATELIDDQLAAAARIGQGQQRRFLAVGRAVRPPAQEADDAVVAVAIGWANAAGAALQNSAANAKLFTVLRRRAASLIKVPSVYEGEAIPFIPMSDMGIRWKLT